MCLFPIGNPNVQGVAFKKGVTQFKCGACPECLRERASAWAVRAVYESKLHAHSCMITLTYDTYKYAVTHEENPVNPNIQVNVRDIQLFLKRLRKRFGAGVKYMVAAEYGTRTHRAHYHAILFGVRFPDLVSYKKSKRGNLIYKSSLLEKIWGFGICTVDNININEACARYCTKYCAKSRSDDTFMLFSKGLGIEAMKQSFNGRYYMIEGHRYPIPRSVWQWYIMEKYKGKYPRMDYRYVNRRKDGDSFDEFSYIHDVRYVRASYNRKWYYIIRDKDPVYQEYLAFWNDIQERAKVSTPSVQKRIDSLLAGQARSPHYWYAVEALRAYGEKQRHPIVAPRSNCRSEYEHYLAKLHAKTHCCIHLPHSSCLYAANDTCQVINTSIGKAYRRKNGEYSPIDRKIFIKPIDNLSELWYNETKKGGKKNDLD